MKRNKIIDNYKSHIKNQHKIAITFHEAGHAAAIYLNNKARMLPPIFFSKLSSKKQKRPQIMMNQFSRLSTMIALPALRVAA